VPCVKIAAADDDDDEDEDGVVVVGAKGKEDVWRTASLLCFPQHRDILFCNGNKREGGVGYYLYYIQSIK
jgi:hypothetical protein